MKEGHILLCILVAASSCVISRFRGFSTEGKRKKREKETIKKLEMTVIRRGNKEKIKKRLSVGLSLCLCLCACFYFRNEYRPACAWVLFASRTRVAFYKSPNLRSLI